MKAEAVGNWQSDMAIFSLIDSAVSQITDPESIIITVYTINAIAN